VLYELNARARLNVYESIKRAICGDDLMQRNSVTRAAYSAVEYAARFLWP